MSDESQSNSSDEEEFDPVTDLRDWSAAETELACFALPEAKVNGWLKSSTLKNHLCRLFVLLRITQNDTRRRRSLNHRNHSHVERDRKSAMGTV
ncbi:MAG: hypothetical protein RMY64_20895 [Nostoc sp. DedQUE08]|uniref:hypothetical protein n=1 Tax=Nostoc sp. DedQUE08 TaxID=3075393 RepID=UPI002AD2A69F|nr:hypothetical protein [Nostoc sp. DedQUE08]MDZ8068053.1 hypothetical protein [Nostoc sp. DedQUE08]